MVAVPVIKVLRSSTMAFFSISSCLQRRVVVRLPYTRTSASVLAAQIAWRLTGLEKRFS